MSNLAESVEQLIGLLQNEEDLYEELRSTLRTEQTCLVNLEADGLDEAVQKKETLVSQARVLEVGRRAAVHALANAVGQPAASTSLSTLRDALAGTPGVDRLHETQLRLRGIVAAVRELLEMNASFAGEAMGRVQATLQLLGRLAPAEATYRADGSSEASDPGRLVRQSA